MAIEYKDFTSDFFSLTIYSNKELIDISSSLINNEIQIFGYSFIETSSPCLYYYGNFHSYTDPILDDIGSISGYVTVNGVGVSRIVRLMIIADGVNGKGYYNTNFILKQTVSRSDGYYNIDNMHIDMANKYKLMLIAFDHTGVYKPICSIPSIIA